MGQRIIGGLLVLDVLAMAVGFYYTYSSDMADVLVGHKIVGAAVLFLFFVLMPVFLILRYKDKKMKSFIWNPEALHSDEEE